MPWAISWRSESACTRTRSARIDIVRGVFLRLTVLDARTDKKKGRALRTTGRYNVSFCCSRFHKKQLWGSRRLSHTR